MDSSGSSSSKFARYLIIFFFFIISIQASIKSNYDICVFPSCSKNINSKDVIDYCKTKSGIFYGRCCLANLTDQIKLNDFILGMDFTNCSLENLQLLLNRNDPTIYNHVGVMDLRYNENLKNCSDDAFYGFTQLDKLFLPSGCSCPGSNYSWLTIDNNTCSGLKSICNSTYPQVECTDNSQCADYGPANFNCVCKKNFHGYKCLQEGEFPTIGFTVIICISTMFLSAILWHTQRRHVKKD